MKFTTEQIYTIESALIREMRRLRESNHMRLVAQIEDVLTIVQKELYESD